MGKSLSKKEEDLSFVEFNDSAATMGERGKGRKYPKVPKPVKALGDDEDKPQEDWVPMLSALPSFTNASEEPSSSILKGSARRAPLPAIKSKSSPAVSTSHSVRINPVIVFSSDDKISPPKSPQPLQVERPQPSEPTQAKNYVAEAAKPMPKSIIKSTNLQKKPNQPIAALEFVDSPLKTPTKSKSLIAIGNLHPGKAIKTKTPTVFKKAAPYQTLSKGETDIGQKSASATASSLTSGSTFENGSGNSQKKKLVVRGLMKFVSSRGSCPPSWVRDFPCKSKYHPDVYIYDWGEGPKAPQRATEAMGNCVKKSARCSTCGIYSDDACRCCRKCPLDCPCPKPPTKIPDVMSQAFGSGWTQAQKVICEMTESDRRAPVGGNPAKMNKGLWEPQTSRREQHGDYYPPPHLQCNIDVLNPSRLQYGDPVGGSLAQPCQFYPSQVPNCYPSVPSPYYSYGQPPPMMFPAYYPPMPYPPAPSHYSNQNYSMNPYPTNQSQNY